MKNSANAENTADFSSIVEQNQILSSIVEAMTDCITIRDLDYNITYESPRVIDIFGNNIGKKCHEIYENSKYICGNCPVKLSYKDGQIHVSTHHVQMPSGEERTWENTACPIKDENGTITACLEISKDVTKTLKIKKELVKNEERFRGIVENVSAGYFFIDKNGIIQQVNNSWVKMYGYDSKDEIVGRHFTEIQQPDDVEIAEEFIEGIMKGKSDYLKGEFSRKCKDGSIGHHIFSARPVQGVKEVIGIEGFIIDTTDIRLVNEKLRDSERKSRAWLENSPICTKILDLDFNLQYMSASGIKALQIEDTDQIYGKPYPFHFYPESFKNEMNSNLQKSKDTGEVITQEASVVDVHGNELWFQSTIVPVNDDNGELEYLIVVSIETTDRKVAEDKVKELARFPSENPNPVMRARSDGTLIYANDASNFLLAEWGIEVNQILPEVLFATVKQSCIGDLITYKDIQCGDKYFSFVIAPVDESHHANLYGQDITERKEMEDQLRQSEKMNAIGQLAGGIAHDFNNQLSGVLGYADMLVNRLEDEKLSKYASSIKRGAKRAAELTKQLLAFSRKGKNLTVPVDIHKLLAEVTSILDHSIDKRINIQLKLKARPSITVGDPNQLQNVLLNIALNARDAMPDGGELIFETDIARLDEDLYKVSSFELKDSYYLKISVTDNGCGMDKETQSHIFEPFFTSKEVGQGTGMGLASAYGTIRNHNGAISVYSEVGLGSTFKIYLPVSDELFIERDECTQKAAIRGTAHILLVDDEEIFRNVAQDVLFELGYKVTLCNNGKEAVEFYNKSWQDIDLVILDMVMPVMNGREAFNEMVKINPDIRAILSSGYSINGEAQSILDEGVMAFVGKPFEMSELSEKIAYVLNGDS
ncbi:MAG: PAS domain-containing hybrid sensor histidine kinase/response regulator [Planctomycetota bacterium]|jgi:PAS domain S-box-containing protein